QRQRSQISTSNLLLLLNKSRTNLTLVRAQQTDSRASNNAIFFDECCGNGTQLCSRSPREALVFGSLLHRKAPPALAASPPLDGPKPCILPRRCKSAPIEFPTGLAAGGRSEEHTSEL